MVSSKGRALIAAVATLSIALVLAVPTAASATTAPAAVATQYNTTPDCPVSASDPECSWNVPVDSANAFGAGDYGQCPYWAAEKYPQLVASDPSADPEARDWDGGTWIEHAQQEGLAVSTTPASGDLAVWQAQSSDPNGHVAYVEAVVAGGIIVSQMDGQSSPPFPSMQGSTEYISDANLSYFSQSYGLEFISTGSASSTPLSNVEQPASGTTATTTSAPATSTATSVASAGTPAAQETTAGSTPKTKKAKTKKVKAKAKKRKAKKVTK